MVHARSPLVAAFLVAIGGRCCWASAPAIGRWDDQDDDQCLLQNSFFKKGLDAVADADGDGLDDAFEMQCATKFQPVVYLDKKEKYGPDTVESYFETCALRKQNPCSNLGSLLQRSNTTNQGANGLDSCLWKTSVAVRGVKCGFKDKDETLGTPVTAALLAEQQGCSGCYLRCLGCNGDKCNAMGADRDAAKGVHGEDALKKVPFYVHVMPDSSQVEGGIQIQYWFFYPFNGPTIGFGTHQGDWEHFSVITDAKCEKVQKFRAYAHGQSDQWFDIESGEASTEDGHLVAYSAVNSHATYLTEGSHGGGTAITKDYTSKGDRWFPDNLINPGEQTCATAGRAPMSEDFAYVDYGGNWGSASMFDGVLSGVQVIGEACPSGPHWSYTSDTPASTC